MLPATYKPSLLLGELAEGMAYKYNLPAKKLKNG